MRLCKVIISGFLLLLLFKAKAQASYNLAAYGGINTGIYSNHQPGLEIRSWEFNNYKNVSKAMQYGRTYIGVNVGAMLEITRGSSASFLIPLEFNTRNTLMSGVRDSNGTKVSQSFNQYLRGIYFGMGISFNIKSDDQKTPKLKIGYYFTSGFPKLIMKQTDEVNGTINPNTVNFENRVITLKHNFFIRYNVYKKISVQVSPYIEHHFLSGILDAIYDNSKTFVHVKEYFNINSYGLNLCAIYTF
ncbi:MAG: hypothetical protein JSU07_04780 [Bacteroidetes bacterium]|nr:hypothetical protein [Bacteroidota bacterium]